MIPESLQPNLTKFRAVLDAAHTILVLQPEKPDTDSLTSALALEQLLGELGKEVIMYSRDDLPPYINYFAGADRIVDRPPHQFDLAILVDCGGPSQIGRTIEKYSGRFAGKPFVIIDHHASRESMPWPTLDIIDPTAASATELIARIAPSLGLTIDAVTADFIVPGIMSDTLGLTTPSTTETTVRVVADMIGLGANLHDLNQARLAADALEPDLLALKGRLLADVEFLLDSRLALLTVDPATLKAYAKRYDPAAMVINEMLHVRGVEIAIVIRHYSPKVKVSIRANSEIAAPVAATLGGGGHPRAAGITLDSADPAVVRDRLISAVETRLVTSADR